ncbi:retrotransposon [Fagus crenata]
MTKFGGPKSSASCLRNPQQGSNPTHGRLRLQLWLCVDQYALEYIEAVTDSPGLREAGVHRWIPPPTPEVFKVNVASFGFKAQQKVGLGFVVRNFKGEFMAASSEKVDVEGDLMWCSALSVFRALNFSLSIGFFAVVIECSDSSLISMLNSGQDVFLELGWVIEDIRELMPLFLSISFCNVPKCGNMGAFSLVEFSKENDEQFVWLEDCPSFLFSTVNLDSVSIQ